MNEKLEKLRQKLENNRRELLLIFREIKQEGYYVHIPILYHDLEFTDEDIEKILKIDIPIFFKSEKQQRPTLNS